MSNGLKTFLALTMLGAGLPLWAQAPATPASPAVAAVAPVTDPDYQIGPGDTLQVFVWRNPELSVTVPVRPDGKISTPLVEDMSASGKTPSQLARDMEGVLAEFVRSPQVNVIVTQALSSFSAVKVVPCPGSLSTLISPPIKFTRRSHITSPRPVPPYLRVIEESTCENALNSLESFSLGIPIPVSLTLNSILQLDPDC